MEFFEPLYIVLGAFGAVDVPYMIVGSVAAMAYSLPRFTNDVDLVADLHEAQVARLRPYFDDDAWYFDTEQIHSAIRSQSQFSLVHTTAGTKIDVLLVPPTQFGQTEFGRRRPVSVSTAREAMLASPEDVILMKLVYYREGGADQHLSDCAGIVQTCATSLDRRYVDRWAHELGVTHVWQAVLARIAESE